MGHRTEISRKFQWLTRLQATVKNTVLKVLTLFSLCATYLLGIGTSAILGKLLGKRFLPKQGQWEQAMPVKNLDKMY
jgi:hypothetical protein